MQDSDTPCTSKDLSELQNMVKSPRKHGVLWGLEWHTDFEWSKNKMATSLDCLFKKVNYFLFKTV